jgi:hypothetical protein
LAISLAYPSGEEGGIFLVQIIFNFLRGAERKGEGVSTLWHVPSTQREETSENGKEDAVIVREGEE